jgi:hypothetical protein
MLRLALVAALFATSACRMSLDDDDGGGDGGARLCEVVTTNQQCVDAAAMPAVSSKLPWIEANVFSPNCGGTSCHGMPTAGGSPGGRIVLTTASHDKLVNADNMLAPGRKLVVPGSVPQSYLMVIMRHISLAEADPSPAPEPARGQYMPQGLTKPICCQKLDAIAAWINAGAPMN